MTATSATQLPFWLRTPPKGRQVRKPPLTPREPRWWIGVVWLVLSALLLGFVAHVTLIGSLQHARSQYTLYQQLRTELALATAPLGQLDFEGVLVPDGSPIGIISIDTANVKIDEVFVQGTTGAVLTAGPGHRRDTVMPGQEGTSIIMGRQASYGGPFGYLSALEPGDVIEITTGQGVAKFEVIGVRREGDLLPQPLEDGQGRLELITADGSPLIPSGVIHIDADLTTDAWETPAAVLTEEVLTPAEFPMASDPGAWLAILFWVQLLLIAAFAARWARTKWGGWQTWTVTIPILLPLGAATSNAVMNLLPNLL
jgi:sortase A